MVPSLIRDKVVDVSCFLQSADVNAIQQGNDIIEELPRTAAQWDRYDVVILYDINPNQFTNEQENALEQLIYRGGGLMFIAGRVYGMASMLQVRGAKMRAMLPVEINKNLHPNFDEYFTEPFHIVRTKQGEKHPILIFNPGKEKNDEVWQSFADLDFFWHHPVLGVKRQAVPLMVKQRKAGTAGRRDCIMALMRYGKGATMYLGVHTMWRWRFPMESFDMSAKLEAKGGLPDNIKRIRLYFMCNPKVARVVLGAEPKLSAIMPCSWSVYELTDGTVWVSHMNIGMMSKMMGGVVGKAMGGVAEVDERFLEQVLR